MKRFINSRWRICDAFAAIVLVASPAVAQWNPTGGPVAHDVLAQLAMLDGQASCLAFWRVGLPRSGPIDPPHSSHYQGMTRHPDPAARVMYVTLSSHGESSLPGYIGAVLFDSADVASGSARLRSNRLMVQRDLAITPPYHADRVVWAHATTGYRHPSGLQAAGRYLAVPLTSSYEGLANKIAFFDISKPLQPQPVNLPEDLKIGGNCAFLHLPDGRYLFYTNQRFYRTADDDIRTLEFVASHVKPTEWPRTQDDYLPPDTIENWTPPEGLPEALTLDQSLLPGANENMYPQFQCFSLVQDSGGIYLIGMMSRHKYQPGIRAADVLAVYEVDFGVNGSGQETVNLVYAGARGVDTSGDRYVEGKDAWSGNFMAGGTVYVSPEGELLVYAIEHFEVGLENLNTRLLIDPQLYVPISEFHHPRYAPTTPHPVTASTAYVALYEHTNFGGFRVELDYPELAFETWDDFNDLPGPCRGAACDFNDEVSSVVWNLPPGMTVRIHEDDSGGGDFMSLSGSGAFSNLHASHGNIADKASSLVVDYPGMTTRYVSATDLRGDGTLSTFWEAYLGLLLEGGGAHSMIKIDGGSHPFLGTISEPVTLRSLGGPSTLGE